MEIINTFEVPVVVGNTWGISPFCIVSFVALMGILVIGAMWYTFIKTPYIRDAGYFAMNVFLFAVILLLIFVFIIGFHGKDIYSTQTQYEVRLEDITAKEFLDTYTILEEYGNTYIITEKEP